MSPPVLEFRGVTYRHPDGTLALDGIDLAVEPGERLAVLGRNGAGKTTLVLHTNGILAPQQGTVTVGGLVVAPAAARDIRRRVGLVFQDPDDQLFMPSVGRDVAFGPANLGVSGAELDDRVAAALAAVGLPGAEHRAPHHLSLGERRRAAIATVLSMDPDLLVLDEPTANLDPAGRRELAELLGRLGRTQVVVTHDLHFAAAVCQRAVVLDGGRVVADAPVTELLADTDRLARHGL